MTRRLFAVSMTALLVTSPGLALADQKSSPPSAQTSGTMPRANVPVVAVAQKPDLVVSFVGGGPGLPTGFTVKNVGNADSKLSVLKVAATLVPPETPPPSGSVDCTVLWTPEQCAAVKAILAGLTGPSAEKITKACGNPFPEFLEAVPVLKPGESKTFMRNAGGYQVAITGVLSQTMAAPQATHVKQCSPTLVCAWDVKAVADASNDNDERNEGNNTAARRALREVSFK